MRRFHFRFALLRLLEATVVGTPAPLQLEPSGWWDGIDGPWTSFVVQVGTGPKTQTLRLYPSTSLPEFYLIPPQGCELAPADVMFNGQPCNVSRGGIYNHNLSISYLPNSIYDMGAYATFRNFGFTKLAARVGWDSFALNYPTETTRRNGNKGLEHLTLAEYTGWEYTWLGLLGLDPRPTNWSDLGGFKAPQDTLLTRLKSDGTIPSLSWGYTAGSRWYGSGSQGSLVLGGYDENRMIRNEVVFPFHDDVERVHVVWVESIATSAFVQNVRRNQSFELSRTNFTAQIDSSRPYIYLPSPIYDEIAEFFNLKYDNRSDSLIIPDSMPQNQTLPEFSITFTLTPLNRDTKSFQSVTIRLPSESLWLSSVYPIAKKNQTLRYIPIRRASNATQYVLGRAFLQNAYLVSDYERKSFSIHQAKLQNVSPEPLLRPVQTSDLSVKTLDSWKAAKPRRPRWVLGLIVAGSVISGLLAALVVGCWWHRRRRSQQSMSKRTEMEELSGESKNVLTHGDNGARYVEVDSGQIYESPDNAARLPTELDSMTQVHEMPGTPTVSNSRRRETIKPT